MVDKRRALKAGPDGDPEITIQDGTYKPGVVIEDGLKSGGVDIVLDAKVQVLPKAIVDKVMDLRQQIIDGKLVIARYGGQDVWN